MLSQAITLATQHYEGIHRRTGEPAIHHAMAVLRSLKAIDLPQEILLAAVLHDLIEDTNATQETISQQFGRPVATLVHHLSKDPKYQYQTDETGRRQRLQDYLKKIRDGAKSNPEILLVKLSDQIDNLKTFYTFPLEQRKRKLRELQRLFLPLYEEFKTAIPHQYQTAFTLLYTEFRQSLQREKILLNSLCSQASFLEGLLHEIRHAIAPFEPLLSSVPQNQDFYQFSKDGLQSLTGLLDRLSEVHEIQCHPRLTKIDFALQALFQTPQNLKEDEILNIHWQDESTKHLPILADLQKLQIAFSELVKNGLFFNQSSQKKVTIAIHTTEHQIQFDLTDNGQGIEPPHWEAIFQPFHVLAYSRNKAESGLGLGLPHVQAILEAHGGHLKVLQSQKEEGTTLRVILPLPR